MGTDIHSISQVLKNGTWTTKTGNHNIDDRDYDTFAVLADIRNGYGFAGCPTGDSWPIIDKPRGLPEDLEIGDDGSTPCPKWQYSCNKDTDDYQDDMWLGDHSHSCLTLEEIENFIEKSIVNRKHTRTGIVDKEEYKALKKENRTPESWCGGVSGSDVKIVSQEEADAGVRYSHVQMSWEVDALSCLYTLNNYIERLRELAKEEDVNYDEVRLVFGFDN